MKIYRLKVNGKVYVVEVESVEEAPASAPTPQAAPAPPKPTAGEGAVVKAPMQGTIIDVKVRVGDVVKRGDVVVVLEAIKLENDIVSTASGTVKEVLVEKGQNVDNQAPLVIIG